ncbi:MAG: hypothetical protein CR986_04690 [Ignavibacteriae bacterium]|nr:MAG: hypothetical protein CR986_04690 [Ignavibacteriota bacterium]
MLKKFFIGLLLILTAQSFLTAQDKFEGKIKIKMTYDNGNFFIDYYIKDADIRMDMKSKDNVSSIVIGEKKSFVLMPENKQYLDLDNALFTKMQNLLGNTDDDNTKEEEVLDITKFKTGKTKDILGYECDQWVFNDDEDDYEVEAWVTDELGAFMLKKNPMGNSFTPTWGTNINNSGYFPLLVITKDKDGKEVSRFEAKEIIKKSLDSDYFVPPSDYEEMKIPGMEGLF